MLLELNLTINTLLFAVLVGVGIFLIFRTPKIISKLIINSIVGIIAILSLNFAFNAGIPLKIYVLITTALFGIPAVVMFLILKMFGVSL